MINSQPLINKINTALSNGSITSLQTCQANGALNILNANNKVFSVANAALLPTASTYNGRMIYVDAENKYYYSTGNTWISDLSSDVAEVTRQLQFTENNSLGTIDILNANIYSDWCAVSSKSRHSLALRKNGTLWSWGSACCGGLGNGSASTLVTSSPVSVLGGFTDWSMVSAGYSISAGLRANGTLWTWGYNGNGAAGDGTIISRSSPVSVIGGFTDWCHVSTGTVGLGIRTNGTLWAWGNNSGGRLGDNTTTNKSSPVSVVGGFTNWCQAASGLDHSVAIRSNGTLWAWGCNNLGQLGDGTFVNKSSPVAVSGSFTNWCQVSASYKRTLGVRASGTAWGFGSNCLSTLGISQFSVCCTNVPVEVSGGIANWCCVSSAKYTTAGIRTNGTIWGWGNISYGLLGVSVQGLSNYTCRSSPVNIVNSGTGWATVTAAGSESGLSSFQRFIGGIKIDCKGF